MPTAQIYATNADRQRAHRARQKQAIAAALAAKGLPQAAPLLTMPSTARWAALVAAAAAALETVQQEMEQYAEDRSEKWQESERAEEHAERLELVIAALEAVQELQ